MMRTHGSGTLRSEHAGERVTLCGWVHHLRDHKGVIFWDLRDASGEVQVVFHPEESPEASAAARDVGRESCVLVEGEVAARKAGAENPRLPTGAIEVRARTVEVLAAAETPPFLIEDAIEVEEAVRLRHRYLDLRRPEMQHRLRIRARAARAIRESLDAEGFVEIETPYLNRATPEGARDFLVPSRVQPGSFFALLQSPQLFKQLLMVGGLERYYQIVRCFRDEDLRADRQFEFTQLDLEMSFVEETDVQSLVERVMARVWRDCLGVEIPTPFPRMPFAEAMRRFGSDKPDARFGLELADVGEVFAHTTLGIFKRVLEGGGAMLAIAVPGAGGMHHAQLKRLEQQAMERGAKGLAWVAFKESGEVESPLARHLSPPEREGLARALGAGPGDLALIVADAPGVGRAVLGALRPLLAREHGLVPDGRWDFRWIVDPPLLEWSEEDKRFTAAHHPFTSPAPGALELLSTDPAAATARAYDLVLNGYELGSGSIRIHRRDVQERVLEALGIDRETARAKFGFLLDAFAYGPPPHGGIALGFDRIAMLLAGAESIRDVIAFPKTQTGDLMTGAPSPVEPAALDELGLRIKPV